MQNLKDKMYNYEVTPPLENWQIIVNSLDESRTAKSLLFKKRNKSFYLSLSAAAAVIILVFSVIFWKNNYSGGKSDDKITVPNTSFNNSRSNKNNTALENATDHDSKKYITITSPQGECVKISSKAAKLIVSSDDQNPPKAVWSAKVNKWKDIMESNVFAPATANFLDVVELTNTLKTDN